MSCFQVGGYHVRLSEVPCPPLWRFTCAGRGVGPVMTPCVFVEGLNHSKKSREERSGHNGYLGGGKSNTGWWFQIFFIFTPIWGRFPIWLII